MADMDGRDDMDGTDDTNKVSRGTARVAGAEAAEDHAIDQALEALEGLEAPAVDAPTQIEELDQAPLLPVRVQLTRVPGGVPTMAQQLEEMHAKLASVGKPLRIRFALYFVNEASDSVAWKGAVFGLSFRDAEDARQFAADLQTWAQAWVEARR